MQLVGSLMKENNPLQRETQNLVQVQIVVFLVF